MISKMPILEAKGIMGLVVNSRGVTTLEKILDQHQLTSFIIDEESEVMMAAFKDQKPMVFGLYTDSEIEPYEVEDQEFLDKHEKRYPGIVTLFFIS